MGAHITPFRRVLYATRGVVLFPRVCINEFQVRWDYLAATDKGYFPYHVDDLEVNEEVN